MFIFKILLIYAIACFLVLKSGVAQHQQKLMYAGKMDVVRPNNPLTSVLPAVNITNLQKPENSFSVNYSVGNTWRPTLYMIDNKYGSVIQIRRDLHDTDGIISDRFCQTCSTFDVPNTEPFRTSKTFRSDGVVRAINFDIKRKVSNRIMVFFHQSMYQLQDGNAFADVIVSDAVIESFHRVFTPSKPDPFDRQKRPFNESEITIRNNNRIQIKQNDVWGGTIEGGISHFWPVRDNIKHKNVFSAALVAALPLNNIHRRVGGSLLFEATNQLKLSTNRRLNYNFAMQYIHHNIVKLNNDMDYFDRNYRTIFYLSLDYSITTKKRTFTFGSAFYDESRLLNENNYSVFYETKYNATENYYTSLSDRATWLLTDNNQYLSLYLTTTRILNKYILSSSLRVTEDGHFGRSGIAFVKNGSNGQDIGVEFILKFALR